MNESSRIALRIAGFERREPAPHPGPFIAREFLEPLGLEPAAFAALIGMDATRLAAMLAGDVSVDVDAAVRFGRSLGLPPDALIRVQTRYDFARSREVEAAMPLPPADTLAARPFPANALHGHLTRTFGAESHEMLFFVSDVGDAANESGFDRVHALEAHDRLRIYRPDGSVAWTGPILHDLDGGWLFAFAKRPTWETWFTGEARADYVATPRDEFAIK